MLDHARVSHEVSVRAPLRIALGGGGTDLPSHYVEHGGFVVSAAIDRRIRLQVSTEARRFRLEHLELEEVDDPDQIRHPILRAAIARHWNGRPLHLTSDGDVPPGTGLGSSGSYTVCAVKALELAAGRDLAPTELAEAACTIEIDDLGRTVGKQDQYAASFGGVNAFTFGRDGSVGVRPLTLAPESRTAIESCFLLFFTGQSRSASDMLAGQVQRALRGDLELRANLFRTEELARAVADVLEEGRVEVLGALMSNLWALKEQRVPYIATPRFEELRAIALDAGAEGVMLLGAGGGGFMLAYAPQPAPVRAALEAVEAPELSFAIDEQGCVAEPAPPGDSAE